MNLQQALIDWDGKSAAQVRAIHETAGNARNLVSDCIGLLSQAATRKGASWLLKYHLEKGSEIPVPAVESLFSTLADLEDWESQLHILQCLPYLPIAAKHRLLCETFLRRCLTSPNKFVRAWTYNGFYELAQAHPEYRDETEQFFEMAMRDESAAVKARVRQLMKREWS